MKVLRTLSLIALLTTSIACSKSREVSRDLNPNSYRFDILSQSEAKADGFSDLAVSMKVVDFFGNPVPNFTAQFPVSIESGINYASCTASDSAGLSTCTFRAHRDGVKTLALGTTEQKLELQFLPAKDGHAILMDAVSGSHAKVAAGTDSVSGTAGKAYDTPRQQIPSINGAIRTDVSIRQ